MPLYKLLGSGRSAIGAYASSQVLDSPRPMPRKPRSSRPTAGRPTRSIRRRPASEDIKVCEAVRTGGRRRLHADARIRPGATATPTRCASAAPSSGWAFCGSRTRSTRRTSTPTSSSRQKLDIPIMATEYPAGDIGTYAVWLTERATDYLRGDIPVKGGLTTMLKTAHLAEAFHMNYEVHHGGNSLNNMAQLHFACAIPNTTYFEVLLPHGAHKYGLLQRHRDRQGRPGALPAGAGHRRRNRLRADQAQADRPSHLIRPPRRRASRPHQLRATQLPRAGISRRGHCRQ